MACNVEVKVIGEKCVELDPQQSTLCQQSAMLLDDGEELARSVAFWEDHSFSAQGTHLGSTNVEHIAQLRQCLQVDIAGGAGKTVAQARTVDEERYLIFLTYCLDGFQLVEAVDGAIFCWERDIYHTRIYHVGPCGIAVEVSQILTQLGRIHLAKMIGKSDYLVTTELHCPTLVHSDVAGLNGNYALVTTQHGIDDGAVGLRASHKEEHVGIGATSGLANPFASILAEWVFAIALNLGHIGFYQSVQNRWMRSLNVVTSK